MWISQSSDLISKVLSPAVRLWLRSQVEGVDQLKFKIIGQDRQILQAYIPIIQLESSHAIYQGLHLGEIKVQAHQIRINIGQVLRGKPLKLLEPIQLVGEVCLSQSDLHASLATGLLRSGLNDLFMLLLKGQGLGQQEKGFGQLELNWSEIQLHSHKFCLLGEVVNADGSLTPFSLYAGLALLNAHTLILHPVQIEGLDVLENLHFPEIPIDLGSDVEIQDFQLMEGQLYSQGQFTIYP